MPTLIPRWAFSRKVHGYVSSSCGFLNSRILGRSVALILANQMQSFSINVMLCAELRPLARKRCPQKLHFNHNSACDLRRRTTLATFDHELNKDLSNISRRLNLYGLEKTFVLH